MPLIIGDGFGTDDSVIYQRILGDAIQTTVTLEQPIFAVVSLEGVCMSRGDNSISVFRGDNRKPEVASNWPDGAPIDLTGAQITMTVKKQASDHDNLALFQKRNTAAGGSDAEILVWDPTGGRFSIFIVPVDTKEKTPGMYVYDIQAILASGDVVTLVKDSFVLKEDVTHGV